MSNTDFSVILCVYGGDNAAWFDRAIGSVLSQTVLPREIVLVVDGPLPDGLDAVVRRYEQNPIVRTIRLEQNQGHGVARRTGLESCQCELVALMDADDVSCPERFEKQIACFCEDPLLDIVGGQIAEFMDNEDNVIGKRTVPTTDAAIKQRIKKRCPMNSVTVMFKRSSVKKAGGYLDWYCDEDYYLWIRMVEAGMRFANVPEVVVRVRVGKDMYRRRGGIRYYRSEKRLQQYMRRHHMIGFGTYVVNVAERLIVQVLMPNAVRGWVYRTFAREQ